MDETSLREERKQLLELGAELLAEWRKASLVMSGIMNKCIEFADIMMPSVADEIDNARGAITRKMGYKKLADNGRPPAVTTMDVYGNVKEKRQRRCSACGGLGHRAGGPYCPKTNGAI